MFNSNLPEDKHSESTRRHIPDAAAVHCLLGKLWMAHKDVKRAGEHFAEALKLNPFMWDAFSQLSEAGGSELFDAKLHATDRFQASVSVSQVYSSLQAK